LISYQIHCDGERQTHYSYQAYKENVNNSWTTRSSKQRLHQKQETNSNFHPFVFESKRWENKLSIPQQETASTQGYIGLNMYIAIACHIDHIDTSMFRKYWSHSQISNIYIAITTILITQTSIFWKYWSHSEDVEHIHCNTNGIDHTDITMFWKYWSHSKMCNIYIAMQTILFEPYWSNNETRLQWWGIFKPAMPCTCSSMPLARRKLPATGWTTGAATFWSCNTIATRKHRNKLHLH